MRKLPYFKDSVLATIFILGTFAMLSKIPLGDVLNPIEKMLGDFQLTDIVFSQLRPNPPHEPNVVLVNIGNLTREGIAEQIEIINEFEPKAIGVDAFFRNPKDPEGDSALVAAFSKVKNLVLVSELIENDSLGQVEELKTSHPMFLDNAETGFADMVSEGKDLFKTSRVCIPKENIGSKIVYSFPTKLASIIDADATQKYLNRENETEIINFQGNIDTRLDGVTSNSKIIFQALDVDQILNREFEPEVIKGKIVILGFMGESFLSHSWTDKFFTPLNANYIGKTYPDMYGVVVHANIVSMILKEEFIDEMSETLNLILAIIIIFLNVWFLTYCFFTLKEWYDGGSNLFVLGEVVVLMFFVVVIFDKFNYKFDTSLTFVALFLSGNLVEIYQGVLKMGYKSIKKKLANLTVHPKIKQYI